MSAVGMYGGLLMMSSNWIGFRNLTKPSLSRNSIRVVTSCCSAFCFASASASREMSVARIRAWGHLAASATAIQPLPVPKSSTFLGSDDTARSLFRNFQPSSASSSVSGRGIRTCRLTAISSPQNDVEPTMCCNGSRSPRRRTSSRRLSISDGERSRSKSKYNFIRGILRT